jgi:hypothetical protein
MKSPKSRRPGDKAWWAAAACLLILETAAPLPMAWGRLDPDPAPAAAPRSEQPLQPVTLRGGLPSILDVLLLVVLGSWLWMMMSRRRREEGLFAGEYDSQRPVEHLTELRAVTYPSEAHAEYLRRRYQARWIDEFRALQQAWALRDLKPVSGIISPEVRAELDSEARALTGESPGGMLESHPALGASRMPTQISVTRADPADNWEENGNEYVTVHFAGTFRPNGEHVGEEFDEYWTFCRKSRPNAFNETLAPGEGRVVNLESADQNDPWVVISIRRGNRERSLPRLA